MLRILPLLLFVSLTLSLPYGSDDDLQTVFNAPRKRIAIIGGGTAGVSALKALLVDFPESSQRGWEVVLFEQRSGVGGVWLPDEYRGPFNQGTNELPETPLYPGLVTNTPHPTMTIPHFPFQPGTHLFPQHGFVQAYHEDVLEHWDLWRHVQLNHSVQRTHWNASSNHWQLLTSHGDKNQEHEFDHVIIANGHYHYPSEPHFPGREEWSAYPGRAVFHSIFFRNPEDFVGRNVLVVGGGASGIDIAQRIIGHAKSVTIAGKTPPYPNPVVRPRIPGVAYKPAFSAFLESGSLLFSDNTTLAGIETVILATGYTFQAPFLTEGGHLDVVHKFPAGSPDHKLATNGRGLRPVWQHLLPLDPSYPLGALWFVGLPIYVANAMSSTAQALFVAYAIADPTLVSSRETLLTELAANEERLRLAGLDPAVVGHRVVALEGEDPDAGANYQDGLVRRLQDAGQWPAGQNFTENWRRLGRTRSWALRDAWMWLEAQDDKSADRWVEGVETEEQWVGVIEQLLKWWDKGRK